MDGYRIHWRLCDGVGKLLRHENREYDYPLGLDMSWRDLKLEFLDPEQTPKKDRQLVSECIMTMKSTPDGRLTFEGRPSPVVHSSDRFYRLQWYPQPDDWEDTNHTLMRFGERPPPGLVGAGSIPSARCSSVIRFLFHNTDLLKPDSEDLLKPDSEARTHVRCSLNIPVSIFWGLVGLRTLGRWWNVQELVNDNSWWRIDEGRPNFDPSPYRPVNGRLPDGVYLRVWISVRPGKQLKSCLFRFGHRQETMLDKWGDPYDDPRNSGASPRNRERGQDTKSINHGRRSGERTESMESTQVQPLVLYEGAARGRDIRNQNFSNEFRNESPGDTFYPIPSMNPALIFDPVYSRNTILTGEKIEMGQKRWQQEHLRSNGPGRNLVYDNDHLRDDDGSLPGVHYKYSNQNSRRRSGKVEHRIEYCKDVDLYREGFEPENDDAMGERDQYILPEANWQSTGAADRSEEYSKNRRRKSKFEHDSSGFQRDRGTRSSKGEYQGLSSGKGHFDSMVLTDGDDNDFEDDASYDDNEQSMALSFPTQDRSTSRNYKLQQTRPDDYSQSVYDDIERRDRSSSYKIPLPSQNQSRITYGSYTAETAERDSYGSYLAAREPYGSHPVERDPYSSRNFERDYQAHPEVRGYDSQQGVIDERERMIRRERKEEARRARNYDGSNIY